jgi:hypothetical protein
VGNLKRVIPESDSNFQIDSDIFRHLKLQDSNLSSRISGDTFGAVNGTVRKTNTPTTTEASRSKF